MNRITIIEYDGFNVFLDLKWTGLCFETLEEARQLRKVFGPHLKDAAPAKEGS